MSGLLFAFCLSGFVAAYGVSFVASAASRGRGFAVDLYFGLEKKEIYVR